MATSDLIGYSARFRTVLDQIDMVSSVDSAVMIQGETGTGKEVIAQAIHRASPRCRNRFVAVNCAAIPSALLESELFGHERGAFTGAVAQAVGRFQAADGGTLFLDEIGDLPLELQPKLLRVLQEKQVERLGSGRPLQIDVRVIAATNQDLWRMVQGSEVPRRPLLPPQCFPNDVAAVARTKRRHPFARRALRSNLRQTTRQAFSIDRIPNEVIELLACHDWPGNIRELQNVIERSVIITRGPALELQKGRR